MVIPRHVLALLLCLMFSSKYCGSVRILAVPIGWWKAWLPVGCWGLSVDRSGDKLGWDSLWLLKAQQHRPVFQPSFTDNQMTLFTNQNHLLPQQFLICFDYINVMKYHKIRIAVSSLSGVSKHFIDNPGDILLQLRIIQSQHSNFGLPALMDVTRPGCQMSLYMCIHLQDTCSDIRSGREGTVI